MDPQPLLRRFHALVAEGRTGFTLAADGSEYDPRRGGYAVGTQRFDDVEAAIASMSDDLFLGWWRSPDGQEHIDLVHIFAAKATAFLAAYTSCEMAVYDFANDELIDCSHFYTSGPMQDQLSEEEKR